MPSYVDKYDVLKGVKGRARSAQLGGTTPPPTSNAAAHIKAYLGKNKINFYIINAHEHRRRVTNTGLRNTNPSGVTDTQLCSPLWKLPDTFGLRNVSPVSPAGPPVFPDKPGELVTVRRPGTEDVAMGSQGHRPWRYSSDIKLVNPA